MTRASVQTSHRPRPDVPRARGVFPALDGLRIVAVTAVVATHSAFWTGHYSRGLGRAVLARLDIGVPIFFVISGFLISREWIVRDRDTGGLPRLGGYVRRRAFRILPMYWLAVVIAFLAFPANRALGLGDWVRHLLLLQTYGANHLADGLTQTWSLCTEAAFYAVLPGIAWLVVRFSRTRERTPTIATVTAIALAVASVVWVGWYHAHLSAWLASAGYWLPTTLSWFMAGTCLAAARLGADSPAPRRRIWAAINRIGESPGVCVVVGLSAFAVAVTPVTSAPLDPFTTPGQAIAKNLLYLVTALALVAPAVLGTGSVYDAVLGHPAMRYLGRISYSVFLLHLMILQGLTNLLGQREFTGDGLNTFLLTWIVSVAAAALAYRFVENPAVRLSRREVWRGARGDARLFDHAATTKRARVVRLSRAVLNLFRSRPGPR